jgi:hypothetical protein
MSPDGSPIYVWEYHKTARTTLARYKQGLGLNSISTISAVIRARRRTEMVGTRRLELLTSTVSTFRIEANVVFIRPWSLLKGPEDAEE